jgi:transposase
MDGQRLAQLAALFRVPEQTVTAWGRLGCCYGLTGTPRQQPPGRPPQLTPPQQAARATRLDEGPVQAGCRGACWRSPRVQQLSHDRCGVFSNVFDLAQWLPNLGLSSQTAALVSAHLHAGQRQAWRTTTWPQGLRRAQERQALRLLGDEASWPQWGPLTHPWARRGPHPTVKTSGTRKGYKVFGVIASFRGRFFSKGQEGRRHAAAAMALLRRVLEPTPQDILLMQEGATYHTSAATTVCCAQQTARLAVCPRPT